MIPFALSLVALFAAPQAQSNIEISRVDGDLYCDVQAKDVPVHQLMKSLGRETGLQVLGFEDVEESARINVFLRQRPLDQTVQYILGSAGLTATVTTRSIEVRGELPPFPDSADALSAAEITYLTSLRHSPDGEGAAQARLALAVIAVEQGSLEKAVRHYELLIESSTDSDAVQAAHLEAGRLLVQLESWTLALPHFQDLANIPLDEHTPAALFPTIAEARRELARCILMRGEPRRAQFMLQGLDQALPARDDRDRAERWLLMARALLELGKPQEGLAYLDQAQRLGQGVVGDFEGMDLRARGMELAGKPVEASLAWLHFSRSQPMNVKAKALVRAAQLSLSVEGEELAVIFLHKYAEEEGCGEALVPYYNEARSRLGLDADSFENSTPTIRLDRGEQLLASGAKAQASNVFESLLDEFWTLPASGRLRFGLAYGPLLEETKSVDEALALLRDVARSLESRENRSRIYLLAAEICERHGRFDEAAEAYGGKL
jgi:tetratricopeptide (TPR) repeat protein